MAGNDVAVLGVGMHPWGKWGRNFVEYGVAAAHDALPTPASPGPTCSSSPAPTPCATATRATSPAPRSPRRWAGPAPGRVVLRRLRVGRDGHRGRPHAHPRRAVRRRPRRRRRHHPEGLPRPQRASARPTPTGCASAWSAPPTPPTSRCTPAAAWTCTAPPGRLRQGEGEERHQRPGQPQRPVPQGGHGDEVLACPMVADPLRLLDICATSDGGAAVVLTSMEYAKRHGGTAGTPVRMAGVSTVTPTYPNTIIDMPNFASDSAAGVAPPERTFKESIAHAAYEEAGIGPEDLSLAEVYDLSAALELDWYEDIGLCKPGEAERLLNDGDTTARRPHPGQPEWRAGLLRRGRPGAGDRPGVRGDLAAAGPGHRPPGRGRHRRHHRQPGPVRPRLVGAAHPLVECAGQNSPLGHLALGVVELDVELQLGRFTNRSSQKGTGARRSCPHASRPIARAGCSGRVPVARTALRSRRRCSKRGAHGEQDEAGRADGRPVGDLPHHGASWPGRGHHLAGPRRPGPACPGDAAHQRAAPATSPTAAERARLAKDAPDRRAPGPPQGRAGGDPRRAGSPPPRLIRSATRPTARARRPTGNV